jgi:hypothetical protein
MFFVYGCGSNATCGGLGGVSGTSPNNGTVSGKAGVVDHLGGTFTGIPDVNIVYSGAAGITSLNRKIMDLGDVTATTDASGKYTLSGLPSGLVTVTATRDGYNPQSIRADSANINFVMEILMSGDATIKGTIEGVDAGTAIDLNATTYPFNDLYVHPLFFDQTTMTYEVDGATDGITYVRARYNDGVNNHYAYNSVATSSGGISYMNISFEAAATIDATQITVPSGYTLTDIRPMITKNNIALVDAGDDLSPSGTSCQWDHLAPLKAGDKYVIRVDATDEAYDRYVKDYFGRSAGSQTFIDNSTIPTQVMINPPSNSFTTAPTTLEWAPVPGANYYQILVEDTDLPTWDWYIYTAETSIEIPSIILSIMPGGTKNIYIDARHFHTTPPITDLNTLPLNGNYEEYRLWSGYGPII